MQVPLPTYAEELEAFHRAFAWELQAVVDSLPISGAMRVADVGCGDGFYLPLLANRLGPGGILIGIDNHPGYLDRARKRVGNAAFACAVQLQEGNVAELESCVNDCDLVWCAQSLITLPEPVDALRKMAAVLKPGGRIAVLENDTLHQLLLPWPTSLEIAIRAAEFQSLANTPEFHKHYVGRRLPAVLAAAGLEPIRCRTQAIDRSAPLGNALEQFVQSYMQKLAQRVAPHLSHILNNELARLIDPAGESYLLRDPHFTLTWMNVLAVGRKPS